MPLVSMESIVRPDLSVVKRKHHAEIVCVDIGMLGVSNIAPPPSQMNLVALSTPLLFITALLVVKRADGERPATGLEDQCVCVCVCACVRVGGCEGVCSCVRL